MCTHGRVRVTESCSVPHDAKMSAHPFPSSVRNGDMQRKSSDERRYAREEQCFDVAGEKVTSEQRRAEDRRGLTRRSG